MIPIRAPPINGPGGPGAGSSRVPCSRRLPRTPGLVPGSPGCIDPRCRYHVKTRGGNVTDRESNPRPLRRMTGDSTTRLKRSAVMSGTGIHRLIYRDICVERGAHAACAAHNNNNNNSLELCELREKGHIPVQSAHEGIPA